MASVASLRCLIGSLRNGDRLRSGIVIGFTGIRTFTSSRSKIGYTTAPEPSFQSSHTQLNWERALGEKAVTQPTIITAGPITRATGG